VTDLGPLRRDPLLAVYALLVVSLPLARPPLLNLGGQPVQASDILLVLLYALAAWGVMRRRLKLRFDELFAASALYVALLALSLITAHKLFTRDGVKLCAYAAMVFLPWLTTHILTDEPRQRVAAWAWVPSAFIASAFGVLGIAGFYLDRNGIGASLQCGYGGVPSGNYPRLCRPFATPNLFLNFLATAVPIAIVVVAPHVRRAVLWGALAALGIVAAFTLSAGVGGLAIAIAMALIGERRSRGIPRGALDTALAAAATLAAAFFMLTMIATLAPRGEGHISLGSRDLKMMDGMRPSIWAGVLPTIREHPLTGMGYGARVSETNDPRAFNTPDKLKNLSGPVAPVRLEAHNVWLSVLGQAGVLGLAGFIFLLMVLTRGWLWRRASDEPPSVAEFKGKTAAGGSARVVTQADLRNAALAAFAGAFVYHGLIGAFEEARHLWAFLGLAVAVSRPLCQTPASSVRQP